MGIRLLGEVTISQSNANIASHEVAKDHSLGQAEASPNELRAAPGIRRHRHSVERASDAPFSRNLAEAEAVRRRAAQMFVLLTLVCPGRLSFAPPGRLRRRYKTSIMQWHAFRRRNFLKKREIVNLV